MSSVVEMKNLVRILKSLADLNRLRIIMAIGKNSLSVTEIIHATELPQTLASFHLKTLRKAGIVKTKRNGPFIYYSLSSPDLIDILNNLEATNNPIEALDDKTNGKNQNKS
jgi:DNA-binding transcriptional ArsR family regulator